MRTCLRSKPNVPDSFNRTFFHHALASTDYKSQQTLSSLILPLRHTRMLGAVPLGKAALTDTAAAFAPLVRASPSLGAKDS